MGWRKVELYEHTPGCGGIWGALIVFLIVVVAIQNPDWLRSLTPSQSGGGQNGIVIPQPPNSPSRPLLGIFARPVVLEDRSIGIQVGQVFPGGPAQRIGLEPGDVIVRVDGTPFLTPDDMSLALGRSNGRPVLTVFRVRYGQYVDILTPLY